MTQFDINLDNQNLKRMILSTIGLLFFSGIARGCFWGKSSDCVKIETNGRVGLWVKNPAEKLEVSATELEVAP